MKIKSVAIFGFCCMTPFLVKFNKRIKKELAAFLINAILILR